MDKQTLSNYGWIVICILVLCVMIALATPFGSFIAGAVKSTTQGLFDVNQKAFNNIGFGQIPDQSIEDSYSGNGAGSVYAHSGTIPDGATYYVGVTSLELGNYTGATATYTAGQAFPATVNNGDVYVYDGYEYRYNCTWTANTPWILTASRNGWGLRVLDSTQQTYGRILESINEKPLKVVDCAFQDCTNMTVAPDIPDGVERASEAFAYCTSLIAAPKLPSSLTHANIMFVNCFEMVSAPDISQLTKITSMTQMFSGCHKLQTYAGSKDPVGDFSNYIIPSNVERVNLAFSYCEMMEKAPALPNKITVANAAFRGCIKLTTAPILPSGATRIGGIFNGCTALKSYHGSTAPEGDFSGYILPNNAQLNSLFSGCENITVAPNIPSSTAYVDNMFDGCTALTGTIKVPCKFASQNIAYTNCPATIAYYHIDGCDNSCGT